MSFPSTPRQISSTPFVQLFRIACVLADVLFATTNVIMLAVIRRDQTLRDSGSFRLLRYLASTYAAICLLNIPGKLLSYYGCIIADHHVEQLLFDSQPYVCNIFGSVSLIWALATPIAHFVLALNKFCTIFAQKFYQRVLSRRSFQLVMWIVLVICVPLGLVAMRVADTVANFVSYDGYCVCIPAFRRDAELRQWGVQSVSNLGLMVSIMSTWTMHIVIGVRNVVCRRQQNENDAVKKLRAHTRGTFTNFFVYMVCVGQASFLSLVDGWDFDVLGVWPLASAQVVELQWGLPLVSCKSRTKNLFTMYVKKKVFFTSFFQTYSFCTAGSTRHFAQVFWRGGRWSIGRSNFVERLRPLPWPLLLLKQSELKTKTVWWWTATNQKWSELALLCSNVIYATANILDTIITMKGQFLRTMPPSILCGQSTRFVFSRATLKRSPTRDSANRLFYQTSIQFACSTASWIQTGCL